MNDLEDGLDRHRIPGLFRRWELAQVLEPGADYHIEDAGETRDGTRLLAIYRSDPPTDDRSREC